VNKIAEEAKTLLLDDPEDCIYYFEVSSGKEIVSLCDLQQDGTTCIGRCDNYDERR
jgi:hypothetical protein